MDIKKNKRANYIKSILLGRKRNVTYESGNQESIGDEHEFVTDDEEEEEEEQEKALIEDNFVTMKNEISTETTESKEETLKVISDCLNSQFLNDLNPQYHVPYVNYFLQHPLPKQMLGLDASQSWLIYWLTNSLYFLQDSNLDENLKQRIMKKFINQSLANSKEDKIGPFGGGSMQYPHLAANYAAVLSLVLCEDETITRRINTEGIYDWLLRLKQPDGSFETCENCGETDTRGVYCALSIASLLNILTVELVKDSLEFLVKCQTFEGGFGGRPYEEAHGGYTFCAVASLVIVIEFLYGKDKSLNDFIDIDMLTRWLSSRQENKELGLNGRSNKLVDGCYSYWVGGTGSILEAYGYCNPIEKEKLRTYILKCCQTDECPGFRDKPGARPDFYHTNYVLLGLCCCDSEMTCSEISNDPLNIEATMNIKNDSNGVGRVNPVYGLPCDAIKKFISWTKATSQ